MPRLHVVGDSISIHYGPDLARMLGDVARYSRKPAVGSDPHSANGRDSGTVVAYLLSLSAAQRSEIDYLMVNCGLHDIKCNPESGEPLTPLDRYVENLRTITQYAAEGPHTLIWVRTTPVIDAIHNCQPNMEFHRFAADVETYNKAADTVMLEAPAHVIDLYGFTQSLGPDVYCDHVHFKLEIVRLQAAFIAGSLKQIIT